MQDDKVWAVTMTGNEADIIEASLEHMLSEGVDGIVIADNLSTDGTREKLDSVVARAKVPIIVVEDPTVGYYQSRKMTELAHVAACRGANWIVPFDIDEIMCGLEAPLAEVLRQSSSTGVVVGIPSFTHVECAYDDWNAPNLFLKMTYRWSWPSKFQKILYRYHKDIVIGQGNDAAYYKTTLAKEIPKDDWKDKVHLHHFPHRSPDQFVEKMVKGAAAYTAAHELEKSIGSHWRGYGKIMETYGVEAMKTIYFTHFFCPEPFRMNLVKEVAPWCRWRKHG